VDSIGLANSVEPANPLFQEFGIFGEVPKDEVMGKLEVTPFTSNLRAEEYTGTFGVGKVSGLSVALNEV